MLERKGNVDHDDQKAINRNLKAGEFFNENVRGPVVQFGMNAAFARRRPRVQIPPGPPPLGYKSRQYYLALFNSACEVSELRISTNLI